MKTKWDVQTAGGESLSTDGLLESREDADRLAAEIERDNDIDVRVVEVQTQD